jgi:CheY-like chemotaxis protein
MPGGSSHRIFGGFRYGGGRRFLPGCFPAMLTGRLREDRFAWILHMEKPLSSPLPSFYRSKRAKVCFEGAVSVSFGGKRHTFATHSFFECVIIKPKKTAEGGIFMPTVLIADDNRQITSILEEYAKKEGHTPYVAFDGQEALELFERIHPDVVLLDVMMPKMDGFEVCREIRKKSDTPVIMITARGEDFEKIMGLDIGADDYIVKPFSSAR